MIPYKDIFLDLDDTLLDFGEAERHAISATFLTLGIAPTPEVLTRYSGINRRLWEQYDRGELDRETLLVSRFDILFGQLGLEISGRACEDIYRKNLGIGHWFVPGAEALLQYLFPKYRLYIASNGVADTQYSRLDSAGINHYFKEIFISETTGHHKPEQAYFAYCFRQIPDFDAGRAMIVGDSLSSDIRGGKNAGIATCWYNPRGLTAPEDLKPDFEIRSLRELMSIL